jgi:hypothetical protein
VVMSRVLALVLALRSASAGEPAPEPEVPVQTPDPAPSPERDPATVAAELFADGRYAEAAAAFEAAYQATSDPAFLFGHAQALRFGGNCGGAIELFEEFIATSPPEPDVKEAERVIEACREILGQGPTPDPIVAPEPAPAPALAPDRAPPPRRWSQDRAGGALVGTGVALVAVGAGLYGGSHALARDRMETEAQYERREGTVRGLAAGGITALAVGGALVVGGIVRWVIVARREGRASAWRGDAMTWRF